MLKLGIVGKNRSEIYTSAISNISHFHLIGVFDPSFQFEQPKDIRRELVYYSFSELAKNSDAIIFSSAEKIYLPLIELALKYAKPVFLHGVHNLSLAEQNVILKLHEEAREVIQIHQPLLYNEPFIEFRQECIYPLLVQFHFADKMEKNLLMKLRSVVGATLPLFKSNIRKTTVNLISACSEVPDIYNVRIDFDNGSVAEITVNNIESQPECFLKCFAYNKFTKVNLIEEITDDNEGESKHESMVNPLLLESAKVLEYQLFEFYYNITNVKTPVNSIQNEILIQQVIEKVKEKLRININIF